ncbi:semaphorin-2A-like isoform X3 [Crassostrea virginica]
MAVIISARRRQDMNLITRSILLSFLIVYGEGYGQNSNRFFQKDLKITTFQNTSIKNYIYLYIDNSTLFVGARNNLIQLNLNNISDESQVKTQEVKASQKNMKLCEFNGKSKEYCQNYIKYIVREDESTLSFCGTDANTPSQYTAKINGDVMSITPSTAKASACPRDPADNTTAVYVTSGNPGNVAALYSATFNENGKATISRPALTAADNSGISDKLENADLLAWLNDPQFVASFDVDDVVYFFFREVAVEYSSFMKKMVSRVARVCKRDLGGSSLLVNKWTTYQKARLNCSLPGTFPFYFNEIQDVQLVNNTFYGLFISSVNGSSGSAICAFTVETIKARFADKVFTSKDAVLTPLAVSKIPDGFVPGKCINNSKILKDVEENFMMDYPLKYAPIQQHGGAPLVFLDGIQLHVLQMDKIRSKAGGSLIFYAASNTGDVYKIHSWGDGKNQTISTVFSPLSETEVIWDMKFHNDTLYISMDSSVKQFNVMMCDKYKPIDTCLYDPYCTWEGNETTFAGECKCREASKSSRTHEDIPDLMKKYFEIAKNNVTNRPVGETQSTTLPHFYPFNLDGKKVTWYYMDNGKKEEVNTCKDPWQLTIDNNLVLSRARKEDNDRTYKAFLGDKLLNTITVNLMTKEADVEDIWKAKFTEWCEVFDRVKRYTMTCDKGSCGNS